ncbi:MAG: hypothetical protein H7837_10510 [Magnetococcus sp. MYC-9]
MKNITVSLDDETYRRARVKAAAMETSVSALVKRFLVQLTAREDENKRLKREERTLRQSIAAFTAADRLDRDAVHDRHALP